ncbi:MAG: T9SS type A sorting domain-containing protein [Bacteroidia bacterium]
MLRFILYTLKAIVAMQLLLFNLQAQCLITTFAGNGSASYSGDGGQATSASFRPTGLSIDSSENSLYVCDFANNRIRKIDFSSGIITTIAGDGTLGYSGDGGQATDAKFSNPNSIDIDKTGNMYITDFNNNVIRKVNISTGIVSTIAGNGNVGYSGDGGQATSAVLTSPLGIAIDTFGNLFFCDEINHIVRKINRQSGIITTIVGTGTAGYSGDGGLANNAQINNPLKVQFDKLNNIYIVDAGNNVIRKVDATTSVITTIAGNGSAGYNGDGGHATNAQLNVPEFIIIDTFGNLFISDGVNNNVVRRVDISTGIISTIAGTGVAGYNGDGINPLAAQLNAPIGLALDKHDNLYIAEDNNYRVRKISNVSTVGIKQVIDNNMARIYPNPAATILNIDYTTNNNAAFVLYDINGRVVLKQVLNAGQNHIEISSFDLQNGLYMYHIYTNDGQTLQKGKVTILK